MAARHNIDNKIKTEIYDHLIFFNILIFVFNIFIFISDFLVKLWFDSIFLLLLCASARYDIYFTLLKIKALF